MKYKEPERRPQPPIQAVQQTEAYPRFVQPPWEGESKLQHSGWKNRYIERKKIIFCTRKILNWAKKSTNYRGL